jgi:hypothetical protein
MTHTSRYIGKYMAHTLTEQAKARNVSVPELIKDTIETQGSITRAAIELKVSTNAVRYWIRRAGLRLERPRIVVHEALL